MKAPAVDVMNTIPITFNQAMPSYSGMGGAGRGASTGLSAVLLHRGARYPRQTLFREMERAGFDYVISVEDPGEHYDLEELSQLFPFVRFILPQGPVNLGDRVNMAVSELDKMAVGFSNPQDPRSNPLFFVLWNDLRIINGVDAAKIAQWLRRSPEEERESPYRRLCTAPVIQNSQMEALPVQISPLAFRRGIRTVNDVPDVPAKEGVPSLYPYNGVAVYDRRRFMALGGFDGSLSSPYWQLMDFGFRAHLWGEQIRISSMVRLSFEGDMTPEDSTADESYRRFYLKNVAPVFRGDSSYLPFRRFLPYLLRAGVGPLAAWADFQEGRRWVEANQSRFRGDARTLLDLWTSSGEPPGWAPLPPAG